MTTKQPFIDLKRPTVANDISTLLYYNKKSYAFRQYLKVIDYAFVHKSYNLSKIIFNKTEKVLVWEDIVI